MKLICTASQSILMSSASVMAHWKDSVHEMNPHRDTSGALPEGSRDLIRLWFAEGDRGKSEPNQYRSSINFDELSVSDGSLESSFI